ncbi:MAG: hypothetical protein NG740_06050 [Omnitrophica bacterium]|nr:hypothetical protein [Candidatus Omnitrophota bacterium]
MVKTLVALMVALMFIMGASSAFAGGGKGACVKAAFQYLADGITGFIIDTSGESHLKRDLPKAFQASHDRIREGAFEVRPQNLRGNKEELARRRGQ